MTLNIKKTLLALAAMSVLLAGCVGRHVQTKEPHSEAELAGLKVGVVAGSVYELYLSGRQDIELLQYKAESDAMLALSKGMVDVYVEVDCILTPDVMKRLGFKAAFFGDQSSPCGIALQKGDTALRGTLSHFIDSLIATGELKKIKERWLQSSNLNEEPMPDLGPKPEGKPLRLGIGVALAPISYLVGEEWRGFEVEIVQRFGHYLGRPVEIEYYPFASLINALQSGKADVITGALYITPERQKVVDFATSHLSVRPAYIVCDKDAAASGGFFARMKDMVYNNLVVEDRWRYITDGLWVTVKISLLSILLGSLFGALVCWMRMSRRKWVSDVAAVYISIMRGIPMLVFLMIMFYVVFSQSGVGGTLVASVSFALVFAGYVSEIFRTAILSVGKGQTEAGLALGLSKRQTFHHIVAPQALRSMIPVYKGECISLVKNTSIVGYIAIQDLTRASDIIRSRTFDALFPLLIVTVLYFMLAWLLGKILDLTVKSK